MLRLPYDMSRLSVTLMGWSLGQYCCTS